jgi:hypothetical protein
VSYFGPNPSTSEAPKGNQASPVDITENQLCVMLINTQTISSMLANRYFISRNQDSCRESAPLTDNDADSVSLVQIFEITSTLLLEI